MLSNKHVYRLLLTSLNYQRRMLNNNGQHIIFKKQFNDIKN